MRTLLLSNELRSEYIHCPRGIICTRSRLITEDLRSNSLFIALYGTENAHIFLWRSILPNISWSLPISASELAYGL